MNTLRTIVIFGILGVVGYGVYATLNVRPPADPPVPIPTDWQSGPAVQIAGDAAGPPAAFTGSPISAAPEAFPGAPNADALMPAPGGEAPAFSAPGSPAASTTSEAPPFAQAAMPDAAAFTQQLPPGAESLAPVAPDFNSAQAAPPTADMPVAPGAPTAQMPVQVDPSAASVAGEAPPFGADPGAAPPSAPPAAEFPPAAPTTPPTAGIAPDAGWAPVAGQQPVADPAQAAAAVAPATFAASFAQVQQLLAQDRLVDAHRELSAWYNQPQLTPTEQQQLQGLLDQLAGTIIYSRESLLEAPYEVQPGDNLERIAASYQMPWQLLAKINQVSDPNNLPAGQKLKVLRGPFAADVDLTSFRLTLWLDQLYAGSFPIGLGVDNPTPEGAYTVQSKLDNPTYYGAEVIDANNPTNPLGEKWISLDGQRLGIHSTIDDNSMGRVDARGCIRLTQRDAGDVYDILSIGSKVTIRR